MVRCSNAFVCIANFLALVIAIPITYLGIWMRRESSNQCQHSLTWSFIIIGVSLIILSLLGIFGSCCRVNFFLSLYLFLMFLVIVGVFVTVFFAFAVTNKKVGDKVSEYNFGNSSSWLDRWATKNWDDTQTCFKDTKLCGNKMMKTLSKNDTLFSSIFKENELFKQLYPIQDGCCQPPSECGFTYVNDTYWETPKSGVNSSNSDCKAWRNREDGLCYDCASCRAGVVASTRRQLKYGAIVDVVVLIYLTLIFCIGCCAFQNNRAHKYAHYM